MKHVLSFFFLFVLEIVSTGQCKIMELNVTPTPCDSVGRFYSVIDFDHIGTSNQFTVIGNGITYGIFEYADLPVKLGPLSANCATSYEFLVRDEVFPNCAAFYNLGKKCCDSLCKIKIQKLEIDSCNGSLYGAYFDILLTPNTSPSYLKVFHNGLLVDTLKFEGQRLYVENLMASNYNSFETLVICNSTCCDTIEYVNPCICSIYDLRRQIVNCDESLGSFDLRLDFKYNLASDSFFLGGNGSNYGIFAYADLPIKLEDLPFMGSEAYDFLIVDYEDALCFNNLELGKVEQCNFDCIIENVKVQKGECIGDSTYLYLDFLSHETSLEGFSVWGNGQIYGNFSYGEGPYKLGPFINDCDNAIDFIVEDNDLPDCRAYTVYEDGLCCDCALEQIRIEEICEEGKLKSFFIHFKHYNTFNRFKLYFGSQLIGTFNYSDLPLKIEDLGGISQTTAIKIVDERHDNCRLEKEYKFNCPLINECRIDIVSIIADECNDSGEFYAKVNINSKGTSERLIVKINGMIFDTVSAGMSPFNIGPLKGDCITNYNFFILDSQNKDCHAEKRLNKVCCENCILEMPNIIYKPCVDGKYSVLLSFSYLHATERYKIKIDGRILGPYLYADLPITLEGLDPGTSHEVIVQDSEKADCRMQFVIPAIECSSNTDDLVRPFVITSIDQNSLNILINGQAGNLHIVNSIGQYLISNKSVEGLVTIPVSNWSHGVYYVLFEGNQGRYVAKVVR
jgi:hypothetical protein